MVMRLIFFAFVWGFVRGELSCNGLVDGHALVPEGVCLEGKVGQTDYSFNRECNDENLIDVVYYPSTSDCNELDQYVVVDNLLLLGATELQLGSGMPDWMCRGTCTSIFGVVGAITSSLGCYAGAGVIVAACTAMTGGPLDPLWWTCTFGFDGFWTPACIAAVTTAGAWGSTECYDACTSRRRLLPYHFNGTSGSHSGSQCGQETCSEYVLLTVHANVSSCDPFESALSSQTAIATNECVYGVTYQCNTTHVMVSSFSDDDCSGTADDVDIRPLGLDCNVTAKSAIEYECFGSDDVWLFGANPVSPSESTSTSPSESTSTSPSESDLESTSNSSSESNSGRAQVVDLGLFAALILSMTFWTTDFVL